MLNIKRFFDICFSSFLLIILSPVLLIISLLILLIDGRPILFTQERIGYKGAPFKIYKFRTMTQGDHSNNYQKNKFSINQKVTKTGKFLRKSSLDEFPQIFNILKGNMSIVGPRPALLNHLEQYTKSQKKRLDMKPGVTGLAQVNGRQSLMWSERINYDLYYVKNYSLWLDFKILLKTIKVVFKSEGVDNNQEVGSKENFN